MAFYLVTAKPKNRLLGDLEEKLRQDAFINLRPFGRALRGSLKAARSIGDGRATWEEEDYCDPPLDQERRAVLDRYFEDLVVERVQKGDGWERLEFLPRLFPRLET